MNTTDNMKKPVRPFDRTGWEDVIFELADLEEQPVSLRDSHPEPRTDGGSDQEKESRILLA